MRRWTKPPSRPRHRNWSIALRGSRRASRQRPGSMARISRWLTPPSARCFAISMCSTRSPTLESWQASRSLRVGASRLAPGRQCAALSAPIIQRCCAILSNDVSRGYRPCKLAQWREVPNPLPDVGKPHVEITGHRFHQRLKLAIEEMVCARDDLLIDHDPLLRLELLDKGVDVLWRHHGVFFAMHDEPGRRAGRQEREIIKIGWRRDGDKAFDFRPPHQQLHADPRAKGEAGHPARARFGIDGLRPIERGRGIGEFAGAVIERSLASTDASEIETQHRKSAMRERVIALVDDLMIHRTMKLRMRMQHHRDWRVLLLRRMVTAFETACGAGENDFRH